jgi:hypothetical protein
MKLSVTFILIVIFLSGLNIQAQENKFNQPKPIIVITGEETPDLSNAEIIEFSGTVEFAPVQAGELTFDVHNITDRVTGYDLQSNASTQQVWIDLNNPDLLHSFFVNSQQATIWSDRNCLYFGSADAGVTWFELGNVPNAGRSGFPSIYGTTNGSGVLLNHNNFFGGNTRTTVGVDNSSFELNFTHYDPGNIGDGPVWPRHVVTDNDIVVFASSGSPPPDDDVKLNTLDISTGIFSGWTNLESDDAEQYDFSISPNGKVGLAYNGWDGATPDESGDVLYRESTDDGLTWSEPVKVFDRDNLQDTTVGSIRGVAVNFYGEEPCVTFEICTQIFSSESFFPGLPSEIHFWSPSVNSGNSIVIADSSNVPFYPYVGTNDIHVPVCRPVIGRSENGYLFIAFNATTEDLFPSSDTTSYMAGYFTYSSDGGNIWSDPEKFTPGSPLRDWRYPSIAEIIPVQSADDDLLQVHIVMQGDSIPGSTVNASGMPVGVTAQYYHFSSDILIVGGIETKFIVDEFKLEQNYPNPFNPSTKINFQISNVGFVSLIVYDVLGNEIATLVNEEKPAGSYEVDFNSRDLIHQTLPSGIYFYKLQAGEYINTKKMILLK